MQQTSLGRLGRCLMAVFVVVSSFALLACPGDDDDEVVIRDISATVPVSASTVAAVQGTAITIPSGTVFNAGAGAVNVTFTSTNAATLSRTGATSSVAAVAFASCTFVVASGGFVPTGTYFFSTCNFVVNANDATVGGGTVSGTLVLVLVGPTGSVTSLSIPVNVSINADGFLVVNGVTTTIDTDVTGTTGTTGG